MAKNT